MQMSILGYLRCRKKINGLMMIGFVVLMLIGMMSTPQIVYSQVDRIYLGAVNLPRYRLTITKSGGGTGTVTSNIPGIDCGLDCVETYLANTTVVLTAIADVDSVFSVWAGGGVGLVNRTVVMTGDITVDAKFVSTKHANEFAFMGTSGTTYYRLHLDDFNTIDTLVGVAGDQGLGAAIDLVKRKTMFLGSLGVTFIDIDTFTRLGRADIPLAGGALIAGSIIADQTNGFVYVNTSSEDVGCTSSCSRIWKINTDTMAVVGSLFYDSAIDGLRTTDAFGGPMTIIGNALYVGAALADTDHGWAKIALNTFTKNGIIDGPGITLSATINTGVNIIDKNGNVYMVSMNNVAVRTQVYKYSPGASISFNSGITFAAGWFNTDGPQVIDSAGKYIAVMTDQGGRVRLSRIDVDTFAVDANITLPVGDDVNRGAVYDSLRNVFYVTIGFGNFGIWKVTMNPFATVIKKDTIFGVQGLVIN